MTVVVFSVNRERVRSCSEVLKNSGAPRRPRGLWTGASCPGRAAGCFGDIVEECGKGAWPLSWDLLVGTRGEVRRQEAPRGVPPCVGTRVPVPETAVRLRKRDARTADGTVHHDDK